MISTFLAALLLLARAEPPTPESLPPPPNYPLCPDGMPVPPGQPCPFAESMGLIYFGAGSTALSRIGRLEIESVMRIVAATPGATFSVLGHADPAEHRPRLARDRAEAVRAYLMARGVARRSIRIRAFGDRQPAVDVPPGSPEPMNRRVELLPGPPHGR